MGWPPGPLKTALPSKQHLHRLPDRQEWLAQLSRRPSYNSILELPRASTPCPQQSSTQLLKTTTFILKADKLKCINWKQERKGGGRLLKILVIFIDFSLLSSKHCHINALLCFLFVYHHSSLLLWFVSLRTERRSSGI